jgi:hypothetical protein
MRIVAHLTKFYDWVPVPLDPATGSQMKPTPADIAAERVRPSANGGWNMKVTRDMPSHMTLHLSEADVVGKIIHEKCRPEGGRVLTRKQAIAFYMAENHLPFHARKEWITKIEVHDDGPDPVLMTKALAAHGVSEASRVQACKDSSKHTPQSVGGAPARCASCGHMPSVDDPATEPNIPVEDHAAHLAAYTEAASASDIVDHLHKHFKVKVKS